MSGLRSRNKGKRAEREVAELFRGWLADVASYWNKVVQPDVAPGVDLEALLVQRNQLQSDRGGFDLVGLGDLAVEVKHHEAPSVASWWKQTVEQARRAGPHMVPVLFYRSNRQPWRVRLGVVLGECALPVEMSVEDFSCAWRSHVFLHWCNAGPGRYVLEPKLHKRAELFLAAVDRL